MPNNMKYTKPANADTVLQTNRMTACMTTVGLEVRT